jgi:hypothetical protein
LRLCGCPAALSFTSIKAALAKSDKRDDVGE